MTRWHEQVYIGVTNTRKRVDTISVMCVCGCV